MATTSQVDVALAGISAAIVANRSTLSRAKVAVSQAKAALAALPTTNADAIATINGYVPSGEFEALAKDKLAKMTTEFQALIGEAAAAETALAAFTEF